MTCKRCNSTEVKEWKGWELCNSCGYRYHIETKQSLDNCYRCGEKLKPFAKCPKCDFTINYEDFMSLTGYGKCSDCIWFNKPEGCNVERDSAVCCMNRLLKNTITKKKSIKDKEKDNKS